ncbi:hypothetical protein AYL99_01778 [Fonsecaea erecta]|uniref:AB hydrolase-1 domain-containing protein n=1 Tax=Fonsecaea erecta TaxID=1367422 RepID=A0A178ZT21_9EURO|nr:hypothetical protein AYL99_01778 [Fonsecaea erecta]OAP62551.1 hypothetical protein AYL99_01778 [Fonsecaea erecta]
MSHIKAPHHSEPQGLPQQLYIRIQDFTLESGSTIHEAVVATSFRGLLNARRDNAVVICHPLSGSAAMEDWWSPITNRSDAALDPSKYCLICCNSLGSPYGSASPLTYPVGRGKGRRPYGSAFPKTTIQDDVRIHKTVLDILGVRSIHCVIGVGMGAILALEWALLGQEHVRAMVLISADAKHTPSMDKRSCGAERHDTPLRSRQKYPCHRVDLDPSFDHDCFHHMIDKIESHVVIRSCSASTSEDEQAPKEVLGQIRQPALVVKVPRPRICPLEDKAHLFKNIPNVISATIEHDEGYGESPIMAEQLDSMLHTFLDAIPR